MKLSTKCILVLFAALAYPFFLNVPALACVRQYILKNNTNLAILRFHLKDPNDQSLGYDLVGGAVNPGNTRSITLNGDGNFHVVFEMSNQKSYEKLISDICGNNKITIYRSGYNIKVSVQ